MLSSKHKKLYALLLALGPASPWATQTTATSATELSEALAKLQAGDTLIIADGLYSKVGGFKIPIGISGTADKPILIKGSAKAILSSGNTGSGTALKLEGKNDHIHLQGFALSTALKGIEVYESQGVVIDSIRATNIGQEGIHLLRFSHHNSIRHCWIDSTGMTQPSFGEGIYLGSAESNWTSKSDGKPDTSDSNTVLGCRFGDMVRAENIDIKEGTHGQLIIGNTFNGKGLANQNYADSWIDVKGNGCLIKDNIGHDSYLDGFQTHIAIAGYGDSNTFANNTLDVQSSGYGINIQSSGSAGSANGNIVCDNNTATSAQAGLSNAPTTTCPFSSTATHPGPPTPSPEITISDTKGRPLFQGRTTEGANLPAGRYILQQGLTSTTILVR